MTPDELRTILTVSGFSCQARGDEVLLEECPLCGNSRWNMEINARKGVYHCWACKGSGQARRLVEQLTGTDHDIPVDASALTTSTRPIAPIDRVFTSTPAWEVDSARQYLTTRGLSETDAYEHGLVVCLDKEHLLYARLCIPLLDFWTHEGVGWLGRHYFGGAPKYISTVPQQQVSIIGWGHRLAADTPCVLVEGAFDGIAVHAAGFQAAVLQGKGSSKNVALFAARLPANTPLVIMLDGDAIEDARTYYYHIRPVHHHVSVVQLPPDKDPADMSRRELSVLTTQAKEMAK